MEMEQLERYRQIAHRLELDRFVMAHGGLYLLGSFPQEEDPSEDQWTFTTQPGMKLDDVIRQAAADKGERLLAGRFLRKLEKSDRNPWLGRISVGRAANNDVVIRHSSVSKLHAHFTSDARLSQAGDAPMSVRITDVGSRNGTYLNGQALSPDEPREQGRGDLR
jgi:hypothetical protein